MSIHHIINERSSRVHCIVGYSLLHSVLCMYTAHIALAHCEHSMRSTACQTHRERERKMILHPWLRFWALRLIYLILYHVWSYSQCEWAQWWVRDDLIRSPPPPHPLITHLLRHSCFVFPLRSFLARLDRISKRNSTLLWTVC